MGFKQGDIVEALYRGDWVLAEIEGADDDGYDIYLPHLDDGAWVESDEIRSTKESSGDEFDKMNAEYEALDSTKRDSDFEAAEKAYQAGVQPATTPPTIADLIAIGVL